MMYVCATVIVHGGALRNAGRVGVQALLPAVSLPSLVRRRSGASRRGQPQRGDHIVAACMYVKYAFISAHILEMYVCMRRCIYVYMWMYILSMFVCVCMYLK